MTSDRKHRAEPHSRGAPPRTRRTWLALGASACVATVVAACGGSDAPTLEETLAAEGKQIFRYDTFGDEVFWTDTLKMNEVIAAKVDPATALSVGLKVDAEALPPAVVAGVKDGSISLTDPATTLELLKLDAVIGLKGTFDSVGKLAKVGITCALCHSTVDDSDSFAKGIGKRLDGWPNRDLDPGLIISLSPAVAANAQLKAEFQSWGKGKFDPRHNVDGISNPVVIPPAYGLAGIHKITFTGDGDEVAYWNRYVSVVEMGGVGTMSEPRLNPPLDVNHIPPGGQDLVSSKLPALQAYQLTLAAPPAPAGSFDTAMAARGKLVFEGAGQCFTCHSGASFTDANSLLHPPEDSAAADTSYAARTATKQYRTSPLKGVWQHKPYFHDGSAATLEDVVTAYNTKRSLGLSSTDVKDLAEYLKSL